MTFLAAAAIFLGGASTPSASKRMSPLFTVGVQTVGSVNEKDVDRVIKGIKRWWVNVKRLPSTSIPQQHRLASERLQAESWVKSLTQTMPTGIDKLLVITTADLSDRREGSDDWRVLGYSVPKGTVVLVSQAMLKNDPPAMAEKRTCSDLTVRLALHELARSFGVDECHWTKCLSYPHRGSVKRLGETMEQFCPRCSNTLWQVGVII